MDPVTLGMAKADARKKFIPLRRPSIVLFGDSRTADGDYNPTALLSYSTNMSWFDWGQAATPGGPVFDVLANAGIGMNTTTQMLARFQSDVLDKAPSHMTLWGGTNDSWSSLAEVDNTFSRMVTMMDRARSAGIYTFLISETTANSKGTTFPQHVAYYNDKLRWYAANNSGVEFWDFNSVIVDPANVNGYNKSSMLRDGLHLSPLGASTIGRLVVAPRLARIGTQLAQLASSQIDTQDNNAVSRNVARNPLMQGTTGTIGSGHTGTLPLGWASSGNVAALSVVARPDGVGNDLKAILSATSTSSFFLTQILTAARFIPGKRYVIEASLGIDAATNVSSIALTCSLFAGATEYRRGFGYPVQATAPNDALAVGEYVLRSRVFTAPADTFTSANLLLRIGPAASSAAATVRLGRVSVRQLD